MDSVQGDFNKMLGAKGGHATPQKLPPPKKNTQKKHNNNNNTKYKTNKAIPKPPKKKLK